MLGVDVFQAVGAKLNWLSAKGAIVAGNVANADAPGYKARDIAPFIGDQGAPSFMIALTEAAHQSSLDANASPLKDFVRENGNPKHSGNSVSLEHEMNELGQVAIEHKVLTSVKSAFHRMLLAASKG